MAKIRNPIRFSSHFGITAASLDAVGALNPTLNVDTKLFIDPLLLPDSKHPEMSSVARQAYLQQFKNAIGLLRAVKAEDDSDTYWRNARKLLSFPEIKGTCLGYGARSVSGSGSGRATTEQVLKTAKAIVDLGIQDPDLFVAMALFEDNFGPDRISDMATNITLGALLQLNARILPALKIPLEHFTFQLKSGKTYQAMLPRNTFAEGKTPVILVPSDILRALPVATDWQGVSDAASKSAEIRSRVNEDIAELWRSKTLRDKEKVRDWAMKDREAFETLLQMVHGADRTPYDLAGDPRGELLWRRLLVDLAQQQPFKIESPPELDIAGVVSVVKQIIEQFRYLIEDRRFSEELYYNDEPRPEKSAQMMFYAAAHSYCKANNLDITPEAETGTGPVDFKIASGYDGRVLVEIKLSTNKKLLRGYTRQLEAYKTAEEAQQAFYVVIDVGGLTTTKKKALDKLRSQALERKEQASTVIYIDGIGRQSASKL